MKLLTTSLGMMLFGILLFTATPAEACSCPVGGSCGVDVYNTPCGVVVCGNDYRTYRCTSGSWQYLGQPCSCMAGGADEATAFDEPLVSSIEGTSSTDSAPSFFAPALDQTQPATSDDETSATDAPVTVEPATDLTLETVSHTVGVS